MIDKTVTDAASAVADIPDGATVMIGGFGRAGQPVELIDALIVHGAGGLTVVNNNAGNGDTGLAALLAKGLVRKIICSFPRQSDSWVFDELYRSGRIELELVPQTGRRSSRARAPTRSPASAASAASTPSTPSSRSTNAVTHPCEYAKPTGRPRPNWLRG